MHKQLYIHTQLLMASDSILRSGSVRVPREPDTLQLGMSLRLSGSVF